MYSCYGWHEIVILQFDSLEKYLALQLLNAPLYLYCNGPQEWQKCFLIWCDDQQDDMCMVFPKIVTNHCSKLHLFYGWGLLGFSRRNNLVRIRQRSWFGLKCLVNVPWKKVTKLTVIRTQEVNSDLCVGVQSFVDTANHPDLSRLCGSVIMLPNFILCHQVWLFQWLLEGFAT